MRPKHPIFLWFLSLCLLALVPIEAHSQQADTGTVAGTVTDSSGAAVPDATVSLIDMATGSTRTTKSNGSGQYIFAFANPATDMLKVAKPGTIWRVDRLVTPKPGARAHLRRLHHSRQAGGARKLIFAIKTSGEFVADFTGSRFPFVGRSASASPRGRALSTCVVSWL